MSGIYFRGGFWWPSSAYTNKTLTRPESLHDARAHGRITELYKEDGLCTWCAAQVAYGHQHGFRAISKPKRDHVVCNAILAGLPKVQFNGWRSVAGAAHLRSSHAVGVADVYGSTTPSTGTPEPSRTNSYTAMGQA